jgi:hypothetical protein
VKSDLPGKPAEDTPPLSDAKEHLSHAHELLRTLREKTKLDQHPELDEAILKVEMALSILSLKTGALL